MNILITGHRGFIGGALTNSLSQHHTVTVYDYNDNFPDVQRYDWIIHAGADLTHLHNTLEKYDVVD